MSSRIPAFLHRNFPRILSTPPPPPVYSLKEFLSAQECFFFLLTFNHPPSQHSPPSNITPCPSPSSFSLCAYRFLAGHLQPQAVPPVHSGGVILKKKKLTLSNLCQIATGNNSKICNVALKLVTGLQKMLTVTLQSDQFF